MGYAEINIVQNRFHFNQELMGNKNGNPKLNETSKNDVK